METSSDDLHCEDPDRSLPKMVIRAGLRRILKEKPKTASRPSTHGAQLSTIAADTWGLDYVDLPWLSAQLRTLASAKLIWLLPTRNDSQNRTVVYKIPPRKLFETLADQADAQRLICPLLEAIPGEAQASGQYKKDLPAILSYLQRARKGEEQEGLLFCPEHLARQFKNWDKQPLPGAPLLTSFARLQAPFSQLISPHPTFDCQHYLAQRGELRSANTITARHTVVEYLIGCTRAPQFRVLEPSAGFNPCLSEIRLRTASQASKDSEERLISRAQAPLIQQLDAMKSATTSCPIGDQRLTGAVDGVDEHGILGGWCKATPLGQPAELEVWLEGVLVGSGIANHARPDVAERGIEMRDCGFCIQLSAENLPTSLLSSFAGARWQIVTSDHNFTLGRGDWKLGIQDRAWILQQLTTRCLEEKEYSHLLKVLKDIKKPEAAATIRQQILLWCAVNAQVGEWDDRPLQLVQQAIGRSPALQQGVHAESQSRAELVLLALHQLHNQWKSGTTAEVKATTELADQLAERCYFGPTTQEREFWDEHLTTLFSVVLASLLLEQRTPSLGNFRPLVRSLTKIALEVFEDLNLARALNALFVEREQPNDTTTLLLELRSGDALGVLINIWHQRLRDIPSPLQPFDEALALVEVSKQSLVTLESSLQRLLPLIPHNQAENPRSSFCRRFLDELGWHVNTLVSAQIDAIAALGIPRGVGLSVRERGLTLLDKICQALWSGDEGRSGCTGLSLSGSPPQRWLLIGEQALPQCWLYRVEQKRQHLESCGAEVRCIDWGVLDTWSFTQQIGWADAVVFCRTPATYGVIRALTFARHCGKKVLADIDDLVFSSDFPAPYVTYGGSIRREVHRRLQLDPPLQRWPLQQADTVISSTSALDEAFSENTVRSKEQERLVLPNLPLPELLNLAKRLERQPLQRPNRLVVSSGTLAHKQIWAEQLAPAIAELLRSHADLRLSLIGHLELPKCLQPFSARISSTPYSDYNHYLQQISEATIALVPLELHQTTHCKSAIKWMEASLLGVVCICSPVRAYTDVGEPEEHLLLAENKQDWVKQVERLLLAPELLKRLREQARSRAKQIFCDQVGLQIWDQQLRKFETADRDESIEISPRKKILVINVFFAPQSIGGATRVAQDQVRELAEQDSNALDITVLCIDKDPWQTAPEDALPIDIWQWNGARIIRLSVPLRPWADIQDPRVESFCQQWFQDEGFDLIHCHCCQVLTASPLVVAKRLGIPYIITLHDGWWLSPELFLVSPAGRLIDPAKPFDHIDGTPTAEEKSIALERRSILAGILNNALSRVAVSYPFRKIYERAGIVDIKVRENKVTPMLPPVPRPQRRPGDTLRICHIGGMALHKGYHVLRQAVGLLPTNLHLHFTVIDHSLQESDQPYTSTWNGYPTRFIPLIPMDRMADFYSTQDILVAPSIWPESFGLVTREALSAGLQVIASNIGALAEPTINSSSIRSVKPGDVKGLADAIQSVAESMTSDHNR